MDPIYSSESFISGIIVRSFPGLGFVMGTRIRRINTDLSVTIRLIRVF
jgi:hypothetical protein